MTRLAILASTIIGLAAASALGCAGDDSDMPSGAAGTAGEQTSSGAGGDGAGAGTGGDASGDSAGGNGTGGSSTGGNSAGGSSAGGSGGLDTGSSGGDASGGTAGADEAGGSAGSATAGAGAAGNTGSGGAAGAPGELPYAHVVAVSASGTDQSYQFAVSVESADLDCTQFVNWWEVLAEDGTLLYRRIIEHSHTDENGTSDPDKPGNTFTRSGGPVPVSADTIVIVRAHISVGGYNGRVLRGTAGGDFLEATDLDSTFAAEVESEPPQPTGCDF